MIGSYLSEKLLLMGYKVSVLSRDKFQHPKISGYTWDNIAENIHKFDAVIHLSGASIASPWTGKNKRLIIDSRVKTAQLLYNAIQKSTINLKVFISASAVGYYGAQTSNDIMYESSPGSDDFLGEVCRKWESVSDGFKELGIRTVNLRTGVVLARQSDAIEKMKISIQLGLGAGFGSGKQNFPWIHIEDVCGIYCKALEDSKMQGAYNAVGPEFITNKEFVQQFSKTLKKPYWLPNVPAFMLKFVWGKRAVLLLEGSRISTDKIKKAGYSFSYPRLKDALHDILKMK